MITTTPVTSTASVLGLASFAVRPKGMVWANDEGHLVHNGDKSARVKISNGIDNLAFHEVKKFPNYREFFEPVSASDSFPNADEAEHEAPLSDADVHPAKKGKGK